MTEIFYRFEISERDDCYLIMENGKLHAMCGSLIDVDLWLENHATVHGLSPEFYEITYLQKPLKSTEISERTLEVNSKIQSFDIKIKGMSAIRWFSNWIVELNKTKIWLDTLEYTGENCNALDNCKILTRQSIEFGEGLIRHIAKRYIL